MVSNISDQEYIKKVALELLRDYVWAKQMRQRWEQELCQGSNAK